ncbi:hypothetical protein P9G84_31445 [Brevibacillus centrosporus]|uniref:YaaC family protein n=1 Tax=Brevibacillus centrosporus TaxID=54910 RepID=UPI001141DC86|nr:hypothetical protein [Brevibacillus centrosporus]MEC2133373.1 hypothetical protein [Brevibacillus centrosporus]GED34961.1 hypothetical protein BCE02nite_61020 [Brevibacillus centrosporus]
MRRFNELRNLKSEKIAKKFLEQRYVDNGLEIDPVLLDAKAKGLSFCMRNIFDYFGNEKGTTLSARALTAYYGYFYILGAIMIANVNKQATLETLESASSLGHGVKTVEQEGVAFPLNIRTYIIRTGFFAAFADNQDFGPDFQEFMLERGIRAVTAETDVTRTFSLYELLARSPECGDVFHQVFNNEELRWRDEGVLYVPGARSNYSAIMGDIHQGSRHVYVDELVPGFFSPFVLNFLLLYTIGIIVRYKPKLWREISEGELDQFLVMIENYIVLTPDTALLHLSSEFGMYIR